MSLTYCLLVIFLLCLSLHACNARSLAPIAKKPDQKFHFPSKINGEDHKNSVLAKEKFSLSKEPKGKKLDINGANQKIVKDGDEGKSPSAGVENFVSVSWHLPQKKRGEKHPGFNLDYSPPKTHPPSHN